MSPYLSRECCATCLGCGRSWCRDETPSPGEGEGLCPDCWELEIAALREPGL